MASSKVITRNDIQNILAHINLGDDSHQEITQADFDALSDEDKDNGTIYFITNGINSNIFLDDNTPIGTIAPYGGTSDPAYWLICDGRAVSRTAYADLFAVIGTTYGIGDGSTTFNIPDLRGRVPMGTSADYDIGESGGEATHTLNINEMPSHTHTMLYSGGSTTTWGYNYTSSGGTRSGQTENSSGVGPTGDGQAHNNMQPYVVTNYIIKYSSAMSANQSQLDFTYPIGSYYETSDSTFDPNIRWGGVWELENENLLEQKQLLWTNPSPTASFDAQTLSLNLASYNYIEIGARWLVTQQHGTINYQKFSIGDSYGTYLVIPVGTNDSVSDSNRYNSVRGITINTNGIVFKTGYYYRWSATDQGTSDNYAVPIEIYGIKNITQYKWHRIV